MQDEAVKQSVAMKLLSQPQKSDAELETETVKCYQLGAEGGSLLAHYYLGRCYETGRGVDKNLSHALYCFQAAIDYHPKAKAACRRLQTTSPMPAVNPVSISTLESTEFKQSDLKELGSGGQGKVYQSEWRDEKVAVKYFSASLTDVDVRRQVEHLAEAKTNQSSYLMHIKAVCLTPLCLVLEYIPGKDLTVFLKLYPNMSWLRRYRLAHDIIQGLAYLHQHNLLHRDLKSANIMVLEQPYIHTKLCDFDSLKKTQAQETGTTIDKVTPLYLDPEYLSGPSVGYDWYHDIYSLGRILWEIATNKELFTAYLHQGVIYTKGGVSLVDTIPKDCPVDFAQLIRDCWGPNDKRPRAAELAERMTALLQAEQETLANQPDEKGYTPLIKAIRQGKTRKVATLLDCKAAVNQIDSRGKTPLFWAAQDKQAGRMTRLLLEAKADSAAVDSKQPMSVQQATESSPPSSITSPVQKPQTENKPSPTSDLLEGKECLPPKGAKTAFILIILVFILLLILSNNREQIAAMLSTLFKFFGSESKTFGGTLKGKTSLLDITTQCASNETIDFPSVYEICSLRNPTTSQEENKKTNKTTYITKNQQTFFNQTEIAAAQLELQNQLMTACEQDNILEVQALLKKGKTNLLDITTQCASNETIDFPSVYEICSLRNPTTSQEENKKTNKTTHITKNQQTFFNQTEIAAAQLELQNQLMTACEQGDILEVQTLLKKGAKPNIPNADSKNPFGAAVWGMNPEVVNELVKQNNGIAPMTWAECKKHNWKHYNETFIVPKFEPKTYLEWYQLLEKIDKYPFLQEYHLAMADQYRQDSDSSSWENWKNYVRRAGGQSFFRGCTLLSWELFWVLPRDKGVNSKCTDKTESGYADFRMQIERLVEETALLATPAARNN